MHATIHPTLDVTQIQNCSAVGLASALLAGFSWAGLTQVAMRLDLYYITKLSYLSVTLVSMCLEITALMTTTLLSMLGPGLALRGPDGATHPAVDGMIEEYQFAYLNFVLGLVCFHLSAAIFPWLQEPSIVSIFVSCVTFISLFLLFRFASRVHARFRLDEADRVVTGRFVGDESYLGRLASHDEYWGGSITTGGGVRYASHEQLQLAGHDHWQ